MKNIHYISAGAGSGKTYTLTETLVNLVKDNKCSPSEVILTTFTELAAAEFRQKAYDALVKAKRYDDAAALDSASIGTVHSVALKYIQKYWYLLGLGSRMNVIADEDKKIFISSTVGKVIGNEERLVLKEFDDTFSRYGYRNDDKWIDILSKLLSESQTFRVDSLEESRKYSLNFIEGFFDGEDTVFPISDIKYWLNAYERICKEGDRNGNPYTEELERIAFVRRDLECYPSMITVLSMMQNPKRASARSIPGFEETLQTLKECTSSASLGRILKKCCDTVFKLAIRVDEEFDRFKREKGMIEYNDMEKYFLKLLDMDIVREDIRKSVKYVFVDEFQDSNPIQIDIFKKLSDLVTKSYWVGDTKQSIYAFRGSAPEVVQEVTAEIYKGGNGLSHDNLKYSYRSGDNLIRFDSSVASVLFTDSIKYPQPTLEHALEGKGNMFNAPHPVLHWDAQDGDNGYSLGQKIIQVLNTTDLQPKDIAVLIRDNDDVVKVASELRANGLPVSSPEVFLVNKAETQLVFSLLKFIVLKDAHTKAELSRLILGIQLPELVAHRDDILKAFDSLRFNEILERVKYQGVPDIVDTIIDEMDIRGLCASWGDADNRQANLDAIQAQAREYDSHCIQMGLGSSITGFIDYVSNLKIPPKADNADNGIKVMTYHGSKGLEWRMVILYSLDTDITRKQTMEDRYMFKTPVETVHGKRLIRFVPDFRPTDKNSIPDSIRTRPDIEAGIADYKARTIEENKRLLYVGITRAKDFLVTIAYPKDSFKWLSAVGLNPQTVTNINEGITRLWGMDVNEVKVQKVVGTTREMYHTDKDSIVWYKPVIDIKELENKFISPSTIRNNVVSTKINSSKICQGITIEGNPDASVLGTCIHNCFAALGPGKGNDPETIGRIASNFGIRDNLLKIEEIVDASIALFDHIKDKYGLFLAAHREWPFRYITDNGQVMTGEMDLVLEYPDRHCILIDYKNTHADTDYGYQLSAYRKALEAGGYKVDHMFIFYSLQGNLVEIGID